MKRIEFSDTTNRLRRNLMGASFLIIVISIFDIGIENAALSGMQFSGLTIEALSLTLLLFLIYHSVAFGIRAFEEYRYWELTFAEEEGAGWGGSMVVTDLAAKLRHASEVLEKLDVQTEISVAETGETLTAADIGNLKSATEAANTYAKRFSNFPTITRVRFWIWDIGVSLVLAIIACLAFVGAIPTGLISTSGCRWLL